MTSDPPAWLPPFLKFAPSAGTLALLVIGLFLLYRFVLKAHTASTGRKFRNQVIMLAASAAGLLVLFLTLPIDQQLQGQILSLLGIVLSAGIALSSTTILGNAMAGFMIRSVRAFRLGEFVELGDHFGRVSDMGLFHVEIQTEDRDLKTIPNILFVTNAVKRIRPSGTILSAQISLGYDVAPERVQRLLVQAAEQIELKEPFSRVIDLGDHAITYKVAGLLEDVHKLLAKRSELRVAMMHALHSNGIEIVSPRFRNTRLIDGNKAFIPPTSTGPTIPNDTPSSEQIVFDKAEEAASIESLRQQMAALELQRAELVKDLKASDSTAQPPDEATLERTERQLERLAKIIASREAQAADKD